MLEKTLESPLDCKEIQPVHAQDQSWVFIGRTDVEAETPILGHLMRRADSFEKNLMLGKIEGRRRRGQQRMRWLDGITDSMDVGSAPAAVVAWLFLRHSKQAPGPRAFALAVRCCALPCYPPAHSLISSAEKA